MIEKIFDKKRIFIFLSIFLLGSLAFAMPPLNVDKTSDMWNNNWDLPIIESIVMFGGSLYYFMMTATKLCIFFFFLNICWHSFKLWFGAVEIKKVVVDIFVKTIMVTALMNIYPTIVDSVFSIASNMGIGNTRTAQYLTNEITATFSASYEASLKSVKAIKTAMENGTLKNIKQQDLDKIADSMGMKSEQLEEMFKDAYPDYRTGDVRWDWKVFGSGAASGGLIGATAGMAGGVVGSAIGGAAGALSTGLFAGIMDKSQRKKQYKEIFKNAISSYDQENMIIMFEAFNSAFGMKDVTQDTVAKIISGQADEESMDVAIQNGDTEIKHNIQSFFTAPFMDIPIIKEKKENGKTIQYGAHFRTALLSPSQMLRIGIMLAKVVENKAKLEVDKHQDKNGEELNVRAGFSPLNFTKITFAEIANVIIKFIFPYMMLIPIVICVVNYVVCMLEYYLVTSVGILFVPLLLFDPTKQYASKLLSLFFGYFMKVMMISIINYACLAFLLSSGTYLMLSTQTFDFSNVAYAIFIFLFCMILSQHAPELGQVLVTGNPSLSAGSVANIGRQMGHAMHMGMHAAHNVKRGATAAGKAAVHGGENAVNMMQRRAAVFGAAKDLYDTKRENGAGRLSSFASAAGFAAKTDTKMAAQDFMEKTKQKMGYSPNKNIDTQHSRGGLGAKDVNKDKIGLHDNKKAMKARAQNAKDIAIAGMDKTDDKA